MRSDELVNLALRTMLLAVCAERVGDMHIDSLPSQLILPPISRQPLRDL